MLKEIIAGSMCAWWIYSWFTVEWTKDEFMLGTLVVSTLAIFLMISSSPARRRNRAASYVCKKCGSVIRNVRKGTTRRCECGIDYNFT